jgi:hypothetical protein
VLQELPGLGQNASGLTLLMLRPIQDKIDQEFDVFLAGLVFVGSGKEFLSSGEQVVVTAGQLFKVNERTSCGLIKSCYVSTLDNL